MGLLLDINELIEIYEMKNSESFCLVIEMIRRGKIIIN